MVRPGVGGQRGWLLGGAGLAAGLLIGYLAGQDDQPRPAAAAIAALLVWATFRFSFTTLETADSRAADMCAEVFHAPKLATAVRLPAPDYLNGFIIIPVASLG